MIYTLAGAAIVLLVITLIVYLLLRWIEARGWLFSKDDEHATKPTRPLELSDCCL